MISVYRSSERTVSFEPRARVGYHRDKLFGAYRLYLLRCAREFYRFAVAGQTTFEFSKPNDGRCASRICVSVSTYNKPGACECCTLGACQASKTALRSRCARPGGARRSVRISSRARTRVLLVRQARRARKA